VHSVGGHQRGGKAQQQASAAHVAAGLQAQAGLRADALHQASHQLRLVDVEQACASVCVHVCD
jgi:hypothetical protein